jgi:sigma-B regulation protein RsbU (phosphoserine phosphatase)
MDNESARGSVKIFSKVSNIQTRLIGTDGIHETRNGSGQMFGQKRLQEIIQQHADGSAKNINDHVINSVRDFRGKASQEDDVTLVVIKLL